MKVKIGDKITDANDEMIMLILDDFDKSNISNMPPEYHKYCAYPGDTPTEIVKNFMKD